MASVTAHVGSSDVTLTAKRKGDVGNRIYYRQRIDPAGATGATTVVVTKQTYGVLIDVYLKNTSGTTITATTGEVAAALSGSVDAQSLVTVVQAGDTGATGVAYSGSDGGPVAGASGAEGTSTVVYDDLAAATGDIWAKQSGNGIDVFTAKRADGGEERQYAVSATGASAGVLAAGRTVDRYSRKGGIAPLSGGIGNPV